MVRQILGYISGYLDSDDVIAKMGGFSTRDIPRVTASASSRPPWYDPEQNVPYFRFGTHKIK